CEGPGVASSEALGRDSGSERQVLKREIRGRGGGHKDRCCRVRRCDCRIIPLRGQGRVQKEGDQERILSEVEEVRVKKDLSGVVVKSDALGSLEALTTS